MKQIAWTRFTQILAATILTASVGCGGEDPASEEPPPPHVAETAPVEEISGKCIGEMPWYCEDVELERCEDFGCKIRVYEDADYTMCSFETTRECGELEAQALCEQIRSCEWIEE